MKKRKVIPFDDYNGVIPRERESIGTLTPQFGNKAPRNGWKIIVYEEKKP